MIGRCNDKRPFAIRVEYKNNDWVRTWAFALSERMLKNERRPPQPEEHLSRRLHGGTRQGITGRIAKQLYPKADITIAGFETTDRKDFYDLAVGNVPFGQYQDRKSVV